MGSSKIGMNSPIRYFGGKGVMSKEILKYFPEHDSYSIYLECFGGGASLLFRKQPTVNEIYNDIEGNVYSLMKVLMQDDLFEKFKEKCELSLYCRSINEEFKNDLSNNSCDDIVDRAFKYWYVNRTSFNGIGGFAVITNYPRRNTSKSISDFLSSIDGLSAIHDRLSNVIIENKSAFELMPKYDEEKVLMYCDPPYHHSTRSSARYKNDLDDLKQKMFVDLMLEMKRAKIIISGYDCEEYDRLHNAGWRREDLNVSKRKGNNKRHNSIESLWMNY